MTEFLSTADGAIGRIAGRQHGVVTSAQIEAVGIDKDGIAWRVRTGRLHRLHRGVYAVGHRSLSWRGRWLAAVLAAGDGAVLGHTSAAALWQFLRPIPGPVHVLLGAAVRRRPRPGLQIHYSRTLAPRDITRRHGIEVTTPARTIEDIRGTIEPYLFRRALRQAELGGHRVPHLSATKRTRSDLELLFLMFFRAFTSAVTENGSALTGGGHRFWRRNRRVRQGRRPEGVAAPRRAVEDAAGRGEGKPERAGDARRGAGVGYRTPAGLAISRR